MRVLIAWRKFDLDNDHRFRQLVGNQGMAVEVPIERFDDNTTCTGLDRAAAKLSPRQFSLLSLPFHLCLLAEISDDKSVDLLASHHRRRDGDSKRSVMRDIGKVLAKRVFVVADPET